jgi:LPXTG-motif cell wall-anchored protein
MDPVCHASYGEATDQYIAKVVKSVYDQSTVAGNTGKIVILGASSLLNAGGCGGNWNTLLQNKFLTQFGTYASGSQPEVQFVLTASELETFFNTTITATPPKMIWISDDWSTLFGNSTITNLMTTNAERIADFVNSGGGLFASHNNYGWLTALLPTAVYNNGGCNGGPQATQDGINDFGLTNQMVEACWHGYFTGNVGTLKVLAEWRYPDASTSPFVAVSIGGGEVSLPSSFTLAISPEEPNAGEDLVITATAQTISGVAQEGVVVTVTVSAGPDAGQTFTATTNASGIAVITIRTDSVGSATYTATATVNGVSKTVSKTVVWNPPVTTTEPPVDTTQPPVDTTQPPVDTTQPPVDTTDPPATTVPDDHDHDHGDHDHGSEMPKTGFGGANLLILGFCLFVLGYSLIRRKN